MSLALNDTKYPDWLTSSWATFAAFFVLMYVIFSILTVVVELGTISTKGAQHCKPDMVAKPKKNTDGQENHKQAVGGGCTKSKKVKRRRPPHRFCYPRQLVEYFIGGGDEDQECEGVEDVDECEANHVDPFALDDGVWLAPASPTEARTSDILECFIGD